jgi:hypothetical protein
LVASAASAVDINGPDSRATRHRAAASVKVKALDVDDEPKHSLYAAEHKHGEIAAASPKAPTKTRDDRARHDGQ